MPVGDHVWSGLSIFGISRYVKRGREGERERMRGRGRG